MEKIVEMLVWLKSQVAEVVDLPKPSPKGDELRRQADALQAGGFSHQANLVRGLANRADAKVACAVAQEFVDACALLEDAVLENGLPLDFLSGGLDDICRAAVSAAKIIERANGKAPALPGFVSRSHERDQRAKAALRTAARKLETPKASQSTVGNALKKALAGSKKR